MLQIQKYLILAKLEIIWLFFQYCHRYTSEIGDGVYFLEKDVLFL